VGSLIEIHLSAMFTAVDQVHILAPDIISNPPLFLELIHKHRVARTFAPNFFLAKLRRALSDHLADYDFDLSCLRYIVSGGEANVVETCNAVSGLLNHWGAPKNVITPGFGMTETCAGSIYGLDCPSYDLRHNHEFASLGNCVPGINTRVSLPGTETPAPSGTPGSLEVSGPIVFKGYYNNPVATAESFTSDGWFKTGDIAIIDSEGKLNLAGRTKEIIAINGLKYLPHEIEAAIEEANISGVTPSYTVCFSYRPSGSATEQACVVYLPSYAPEDTDSRMWTLSAITTIVMLFVSARPRVLPLDASVLQKTTLGKLSRTKIRTSLEKGEYKVYEEVNDEIIKACKTSSQVRPSNELERVLLKEIEDMFELPEYEIGVESSVFDMGMTSVELIRLKRRIEQKLELEIPMATMMTHTTVRSLAKALDDHEALLQPVVYNPVVMLQSQGTKAPLWLVHPGVGEILCPSQVLC
jgi:acyl-CoA synthetase (AMP-forming)/AMP-acid ligase II/acyl carrier protein